MLPYTPLHLLLLEPEPGFPEVFVMTSANLAEEPIAYRDQDARSRLSSLADGFLLHNRDIHMRVDDSVIRVTRHGFYPIRRARGYSPNPIRLPHAVPPILAAGAELKNTFCLTRDDYAFLSHHIGDLENYETLQSFEEGITHYERLFRITPEAIACDLHPNYLATRYAQERAARESLPIITVQHHHAHLAACLADNGWDSIEPVIGVSLDGTGYGPDGAIWGCEFLLGNYQGFERLAHLKYVPLPGGDLAIKTVSRMALAHLWAAGQDWETDLPPVQALCAEERTVLKAQLSKGINSPLTSSMGRLFDAASALLGVRQTATYEGQAAIELENLCDPAETGFYPLEVRQSEIDPQGLWEGLLHDWRGGVALPLLAARFHNSIIRIVLDTCKSIREKTEVRHVALSGGVWQNKFLFERTIRELEQAGFIVLSHRQTPANDGGIALGQALIAAASINP
jgi:hydrogenase maturation protein HypF